MSADMLARLQAAAPTPARPADPDALWQRGIRRRRRRAIALASVVVVTVVASGTGLRLLVSQRSSGETVGLPSDPSPTEIATPTGRLYLANLSEQSFTVVDAESGDTRTVPVPEFAAGDAQFRLVLAGDKFVFRGGNNAFVIGTDLEGTPQKLGESWYFVPSATEGRVWLAFLSEESSDTDPVMESLQEVTVDGAVTVDAPSPPAGWLSGAVNAGPVFQDDTLFVWDPETRETVLRVPGVFPVDTHEDLFAWCDYGCAEIHITDTASDADAAVAPAAGFTFRETYDGAFSPDGSLLAVPVKAEDPAYQVALIDVSTATASLVPGSRLNRYYPSMEWSATGEWLFFNAGDGEIMAYRPGEDAAMSLPVRVQEWYGLVAI